MISRDLLCLGRAALDLYGGPPELFSQQFKAVPGGCALNVAVGTARLGLRVALGPGFAPDPGGDLLRSFAQAEGISVPDTALPNTATPLITLWPNRVWPRAAGAPDLALTPELLPPLHTFRALYLTGTSCAGEPARTTALLAARQMKQQRRLVVLDADHRPPLWNHQPQVYVDALAPLLPWVTLLAGTEVEIDVLGGPATLLRAGVPFVLVHSAAGATLHRPQAEPLWRPAQTVARVVDPMGAGDAFLSAFLSAWLEDLPLGRALELAHAAGAYMVQRQGCAPHMPRREDLAWPGGAL